jgi:transcriptional regulator with XRE-family HTH domain
LYKSPTVHRRRLGSELRRLREAAGLTHREVAVHLDCSQGKISQIELGRVPVRTSDVRLMAEFCGATAEQVAALVDLAQGAKQRGWWQQYPSTAHLPRLQTYLGLETAARAVHCFGTGPLPDLLQTQEYARELLTARIQQLDIAEQLEILARRQHRLGGEHPLQVWAVLDESVVRRRIGGPGVMRHQLEQLVLLNYRRNITIQVLPFRAGAHPLLEDQVTVFSFPEEADPPVVHLGPTGGSRFLEKPSETDDYLAAFEQVSKLALPPKETTAFISAVASEIT